MLNISFTIITAVGLSFSVWALLKVLNINTKDMQHKR